MGQQTRRNGSADQKEWVSRPEGMGQQVQKAVDDDSEDQLSLGFQGP